MSSALQYAPTLAQVAEWVVHSVATSTTVINHCVDNYGKSPIILEGVMQNTMPSGEIAPFITIERDRHIGGTAATVRQGVRWELYKIVIAVGVLHSADSDYAEETKEATATQAQVISILPTRKAEELAYLVRNALDEGLPSQLLIEECEVITTDTVHNPLFVTILELTISTPVPRGCAVTINPPP